MVDCKIRIDIPLINRLLITTTCRKANYNEPSGHLYVFDLERNEIIQKGSIIEPPYRDVDPNPRGGFRGGKGIAIHEDQIFLANTAGIFCFDQRWDLIKVISHPSCSGIHDILFDKEKNLWVTSARNDILFKFDLDGNILDYYYFRQDQQNHNLNQWTQPRILSNEDIEQGTLDFRDPRTHMLASHDTVHVNSVGLLPNAEILVSLGFIVGKEFSTLLRIKDILSQRGLWSWIVRINQFIRRILTLEKDRHSELVIQPLKGKSIIARLHSTGKFEPCFIIDNVNVPSHSVLARSDGTAVYLNTTIGNVLHFDPGNGKIISSTNVSNNFLRGICKITEDELIVGSQNQLIWFSLKTLKVMNQFTLSDNQNETVFAIHALPEQFSKPPISFETYLGKLVCFNGFEPIFDKSVNSQSQVDGQIFRN